MQDSELMQLAIDEARKSEELVGCGVVIAKDGQVIAKSYNQQRKAHDATAHAEILSIREAGQKLGAKNLTGCIAYCTCEPCTMCLSAFIFARVETIHFGTSMIETFPDNLPITLPSSVLLDTTFSRPQLSGGLLRESCLELVR